MKKWELIFTETENGEISISAMQQGFNAMELIALLELKKADILAQMDCGTKYTRVLIEQDGTKVEMKEEE